MLTVAARDKPIFVYTVKLVVQNWTNVIEYKFG